MAFAYLTCRWANAMTTMRLAGSALGVALVVFGPSCARAATVTYMATGEVAGESPSLQGQFPIGTPFTYTFTLNTAVPNTGSYPPVGYYTNGLVSSSGRIGSYSLSTVAGDLAVGKAPSFDIFMTQASQGITAPAVGGVPIYDVQFILRDDTKTALSSNAVPLSLNLSAFSSLAKLNLVYSNSTELQATVTGLEVINPVTGLANPVTGLANFLPSFFLPSAILPLLSAGSPRNVVNVAAGIDNAVTSGATVPTSFNPLYALTGTTLKDVLPQLSGEAATGAQRGAFQLTSQFLDTMLDPFVLGGGGIGRGPALGFAAEREALPEDVALAYAKAVKAPVYKAPPPAPFEQRWSVWAAGYGGYNHTDGDPAVVGSHDLTARAFGVAGGFDYHFSPDTVAGFALAGGGTNWSLAQGLGGGKSDAFQAGVYAATRSGPWYLAGALAFTNHWMSTDRFAAFGDHLTADFNAQSFGGRAEGGYRFATAVGGVAPYAALQAQSFRMPNFNETDVTGGGFALSFNGHTSTDTRSELGARFDHAAVVSPDAVLILRGRLAWAHDWITDATLVPVFQALPGSSFIVNGAAPAENSALVSAGAELRLANGVALLGKFDGDFASHSQTYAGTGTLRYTW
jgi:outer membrane autotransporter protein